VTRAGVEVDVDMETTELGCYMWGSYVTDRTNTGIAKTGYRAFVTWEPLTPEVEAENSLRFWRWLIEIRQECSEAGVTLRRTATTPVPRTPTCEGLRSLKRPSPRRSRASLAPTSGSTY
jgi:hypothetical protein